MKQSCIVKIGIFFDLSENFKIVNIKHYASKWCTKFAVILVFILVKSKKLVFFDKYIRVLLRVEQKGVT